MKLLDRYISRQVLLTAAMAVAVLAVRIWVGEWAALSTLWRWLWLLAAVCAGAATYGAALLLSGLRLRHLRY